MYRLLALLLLLSGVRAHAAPLQHHVFFNRDRERIREAWFLAGREFAGALLKYTWRELEPEPGAYALDELRADLRLLREHGKQLVVQLQDVSFSGDIVNVPGWLLEGEGYGGGVARQYVIPGDDEARAEPEGWVARRWDPAVRARFHRLLRHLGRELDGEIEALVVPETSIEFGSTGELYPAGFTPEVYRDAVLATVRTLGAAFRRTTPILYANFMPGEWLPWEDRGYLRSVYREARRHGVGLGGPDWMPGKKAQENHAYRLLRETGDAVPLALAVQWGNYAHVDPRKGRPCTIAELIGHAEELGIDRLFWCTQEPWFGRDLRPHLAGRHSR